MALNRYHSPSIASPLKVHSKPQAMEDHLKNHQEVLQILKDNMATSRNMMKQ